MNINAMLFRQVNIAPLVVFRLVFGALLFFGTLRFISKGWVAELYIDPPFHFTYLGFDWVKPLPGEWMYLPFILMILASVGIILGAFYRLSTTLFFVAFTYVELLDKTNYLNHYYFVSLMVFLMIFLPAHHLFSVDAYRKPDLQTTKAAWWQIFILRFQLGVVYFFAGLAKLEPDWLFHAQPLKTWLQAYRDLPLVGNLMATAWVAFFFSWFGCIYDLTIPFFLSVRKTRPYAYFFVIVFHVVTWLLFPIGVFPWVMIFSTLIFFSDDFHQRILDWCSKRLNVSWSPRIEKLPKKSRSIAVFLSIYIFIQLLLPFRYLLYQTDVFWTEEGFRFSWRVMLMHKEGNATFYVKDRTNGREMEIQNCMYLTPNQIDQMSTQPDFILQYAHFLQTEFKDTTLTFGEKQYHLKNPSVHADVFVSLNGRISQQFVDKKLDLTKISYNFAARTWIEPF